MALPSAPLGSMPSLNVPTHIPKTVVNKQPKLWEQALMGILAQAAGSAVSQGVGNSMSRDYAGEYGETPATGWDAFVKGPKVSEKEHSRRQAVAHDKEMMGAKAALDIGTQELRDMPGRREVQQQYEPQLASVDRSIADMRQITSQSKMNRRDTHDKATIQANLDDVRYGRDEALVRLRQELADKSPGEVEQTRKDRINSDFQEQMNRHLFKPKGPAPVINTGEPTSGMKKYGQATAPRPPETPDPQLQSVIQQFEQRLAAPQQTPTADPSAFTLGKAQITDEMILQKLLSQLVSPQTAQQ